MSIRYFLTRIGEALSERQIRVMDAALNYLETGRWMRAKGYAPIRRVSGREQLWELAAASLQGKAVLYLEFGVFRGDAMRRWVQLLPNARCMFHGFDSFEGLPEAWRPGYAAGHFDVRGTIPIIEDPRVTFHKGWFDQTLPKLQVPEHEVLVLNIDADLYSSTKLILEALRAHVRVGSYLYFDEFNERFHEQKAFADFLNETKMTFELVGATQTLQKVLFVRTK